MTQEKLEALLGRPLTTTEVTNIDLYLDIANDRLEQLICTSIEPATEDRIYEVRQDYTTVFTDIFTSLVSVKDEDGTIIDPDSYSVRQWNKRNGSWYNSIVFDDCLSSDEITVKANWGFDSTGSPAVYDAPSDLQLLIAKLFDLVSSMNNSNGNIRSKRVEDFTITFSDNTIFDQFLLDNQSTISKYSLCGISTVRSGEVDWRY